MGSLGWRLSMGKVQVLPDPTTDLWVVADGETGTWSLDDLPDSGAWQVTAYNTGSSSHKVYLEFAVDVIRGLDDGSLPAWPLVYAAGIGSS
jgi:hypothetical protein